MPGIDRFSRNHIEDAIQRFESNDLTHRAYQIAKTAHHGQLDKASMPYITHPIRVASSFDDPILQAVGLLHDVIEDCDVTSDDLRAQGMPEEVVQAVLCLTRKEGEVYQDFIHRAGENERSRLVKIADIRDNTDKQRMERAPKQVQDTLASLQKRYTKALDYLLQPTLETLVARAREAGIDSKLLSEFGYTAGTTKEAGQAILSIAQQWELLPAAPFSSEDQIQDLVNALTKEISYRGPEIPR
jgi:hypothetical protein